MLERFRINEPGVVHETIDGEVVIINLETGAYYSLGGTAVEVWGALSSPTTTDEVVGMICERFAVEPQAAMQDVQRFLDELKQEDLLTAEADVTGSRAAFPVSFPPQRAAYQAPTMQKFTDMTHLLLLDPVHDVDEHVGWPIAAR